MFLKNIPSLSILDLVSEPSCKAEKITQRISVSNGEKYFHLQPARVEGRMACCYSTATENEELFITCMK